MEKERLEWVMSGLSHYLLTAREDQFIKSVKQDFSQNNMLTEEQEEKLESLYKEKSKLIPNRNYFSPKESSPQAKTKVKGVRPKWIS
jgi:O-methyltransferase involved in polyketide biosynthesis